LHAGGDGFFVILPEVNNYFATVFKKG
jgi:hypothetical protein